ncbi:alpha/beta hydrolase fold domain-containing protein [Oceanibium sediminis]|uniref:alpha/beta hydrolase fold domain-containing protein n=1 Tax=Oceanibium sediminis TaxID=2026339 RepID=UPI000DD490FF|nr:alpha/beta hydrolase fold domain-containing protein [Oceanibium sediminis]
MSRSRALTRLRWLARHLEKPVLARARRPWLHRLRTEPMARLLLRGRKPLAYRSETIGGVACRVLKGGGGTVFYVHGGAFILFSARSHQGLAARLAQPFGFDVVLPEYARAPEAAFPRALDEVTACYEAVAAASVGPVILAGDSAGGGLALALLHRILHRGLPLPAAVLAFSPWVDLTLSGPSIAANAKSDPILPANAVTMVRDMYLQGGFAEDPEASPVFGDFANGPPVLIQVCEDEILLSDSQAMARRIEGTGGRVTLQVLPEGLHAFQLFLGWIPEADRALDACDDFLRQILLSAPSSPAT